MFDCIVVGAGPAGATAAYQLAKRGRSVLVVEKETLPRYKPCGGGVSPAVASWFDFDFSPVIDNTITQVHYSWQQGDEVEVQLQDVKPMWMVHRDTFDHFLMQQAQALGAQLKDNTEVLSLQRGSDSVEVVTSGGNFTGAYLIAAEGVKGTLTTSLGFTAQQKGVAASLEIEAKVPSDRLNTAYFEFGSLKNGYIWNFPKTDGYSFSAAFLRGNNGKPQELQKQLTNYAKQFGVDLTKSQYFEYSLNLWTQPQPLHRERVLVAGEAAGIVDPLTGEGIRPAMFTGLKAAQAIDQALTGNQDALANYSEIINQEWKSDLVLANRLAGLFFQFPKIAYKVGVKRPRAAQMMGKILCGELRYSDVSDQAMKKLKKSLIPGIGR